MARQRNMNDDHELAEPRSSRGRFVRQVGLAVFAAVPIAKALASPARAAAGGDPPDCAYETACMTATTVVTTDVSRTSSPVTTTSLTTSASTCAGTRRTWNVDELCGGELT